MAGCDAAARDGASPVLSVVPQTVQHILTRRMRDVTEIVKESIVWHAGCFFLDSVLCDAF